MGGLTITASAVSIDTAVGITTYLLSYLFSNRSRDICSSRHGDSDNHPVRPWRLANLNERAPGRMPAIFGECSSFLTHRTRRPKSVRMMATAAPNYNHLRGPAHSARAPYCPRVAVGLVPAWRRLSYPREHMALALYACMLAANMIVIQALIHGDACTGGVIDVHDMQ
jgi:hypothetical protein